MNLTEALKFVEEHVPATIDHKIEAVEKLLSANKDEFARATAELSALVSQSSTLASYLDTVKTRVESAEAQLAKLQGDPPPVTPAVVNNSTLPQPGQPVVTTTTK
jgi:peptidoglycan hydrolase CwlO-like protein